MLFSPICNRWQVFPVTPIGLEASISRRTCSRTRLALLASFALIPIAGGRTALLLIPPAAVLLVNFDPIRDLHYYYSYPFVPFLVYSAAEGAARLTGRSAPAKRRDILIAAALVVAGCVQLFLPTRTDELYRVPSEVTPRDMYRLQVARDLVPRNQPVALQFGLWGITPTNSGVQMLGPKPLRADAYAFFDLNAAYGMPTAEYVSLVGPVFVAAEQGNAVTCTTKATFLLSHRSAPAQHATPLRLRLFRVHIREATHRAELLVALFQQFVLGQRAELEQLARWHRPHARTPPPGCGARRPAVRG